MKNHPVLLLTLGLLFIAAFAIAGDTEETVTTTTATDDKANEVPLSVTIKGRFMLDSMMASADADYEAAHGVLNGAQKFKLGWLELNGKYGKNMEFKAWYDLTTGSAKELWVGFNNLPFGKLKFGHTKEPFSLEMLESVSSIQFMERSISNMFAPARNTGLIALNNHKDGKYTWQLGAFRDADGFGNVGAYENKFSVTGRATFLPWRKGNSLFHLGGAARIEQFEEGAMKSFAAKPETGLASAFVASMAVPTDSMISYNFEFLFKTGKLSIQSEYRGANITASAGNDISLNGFYAQAMYTLTSETRGYNNGMGTITGIKPKTPYGAGGIGAWEVGARFSMVDLTDGLTMGGKAQNCTIGLNWIPNPYSRFMFNYVNANNDDTGTANIFQVRAQFSF
jgi:phosphate-selective porin OprO/OprP